MNFSQPFSMEIKDQIRSFLATNFYVPDPTALADDASLLDQGLIDSTGVLEVIEFLESTFEIKVDDAEMLPENLDSVERIVAFVERKRIGV
jgi:acyl carrier protein